MLLLSRLGIAWQISLVVSVERLLPQLNKLPFSLRTSPRHSKVLLKLFQSGEPPPPRRVGVRQALLDICNGDLLPRLNKLQFSLKIPQRHSKVLLKLFQKLAVSKGRAFGRSPQRAKYFMLLKAQEGRKTFQWNVFRREPSQGVP